MNLESLYNLKERLENIVIAGTNLIDDDFKLKKAVEDMSSLASVNPVFAKIQTAANAIFTTEKENRNKQILSVLGTVYAVVKTQGTIGVKDLDGFEEVVTSDRPHTNIPYSILYLMDDAVSNNYAPVEAFLNANPTALSSTYMFKKTFDFYKHSRTWHLNSDACKSFQTVLAKAIQNDKSGKYVEFVKETMNIHTVVLLDVALGDYAGSKWYAENIGKFKANDSVYLYFKYEDVPAWLYVKQITVRKSKDVDDNIKIAKYLVSKHPGCPEIQEVLDFFKKQGWDTKEIIEYINKQNESAK